MPNWLIADRHDPGQAAHRSGSRRVARQADGLAQVIGLTHVGLRVWPVNVSGGSAVSGYGCGSPMLCDSVTLPTAAPSGRRAGPALPGWNFPRNRLVALDARDLRAAEA